MHVVEIRRRGADLGATMAQMRAWLDHRQSEPSLFELTFLARREIRFRVQFQNASDALAFARAFEGKVSGELDIRAGNAAA
jgi:hypothetical protein